MNDIDELYVGWQDRASRQWFPVGRLTLDDEGIHCFKYLRGARVARERVGFRGIAQFSDFERTYRSDELFPFFRNRVKSLDRADSEDELHRLGLPDPEVGLRPFDILSRSNGRRVTDRFEIYPPPSVEEQTVRLTFFSRGVRHLDKETTHRWRSGETPVQPVRLRPEPDNDYDSNAMRIVDAENWDMGYLPRYYTASFAQLLDVDVDYSIEIYQINSEPAYPQHRFLLQFESETPPGWTFPQSDLYTPIPTGTSDRRKEAARR